MTNDASPVDTNDREGEIGAVDRGRDVIVFGEFAAHLRSGELFRGGALVKLQLQPFRVLTALLRRPGDLVTREELRREVWGDHTAVDFEHGLNFCIKQVRAALGDSADRPSFIETLPRRGYRFIGQISIAPSEHPSAIDGGQVAPVGPEVSPSASRNAVARVEPEMSPHSPGAPAPSRDPGEPTVRPPARAAWAWAAFFGVLVTSVALAVFALRARSVRDPNAPLVLFVVPFENMTGDSASDVWCDGLTEETIVELASADPRHFQVIARTTSMAYRAAHKPLREIGRQVKADFALEGAVRKAGDRLRVTAQLYRLKEETPVWAQAFEATGNDILSIQRTLASQLAASLAITVAPETRPAPSVAAQEALSKARYLRKKNEPDALLRTIAAFEEALRLDPDNATAWSELAMSYDNAAGIMPPKEALDKSCAAAKRAHELSNQEALADTAVGLCALQRDWDWTVAERSFDSAVAKNPGLATAYHYQAAFLSAAGRHRDAMRAILRAKTLDPLSPAVVSDAGWHAYLGRAYPEAIRELKRTLELEPKDVWSREHLMMARALSGDASGAAKDAAIWATMFPSSDAEKASLAAFAPNDVVRGTSQIIAERLAARAKTGEARPNPAFLAAKYAAAGNRDEALAWLERGASEHTPWFLPMLRDPRFDLVRGDPRFAAICAGAHLPAGD